MSVEIPPDSLPEDFTTLIGRLV